ncbi:TetR/AcrR family transcriptional regulator [Tateyamaria sp. syn59]|uniref:TetR/AcrR family transcriptional regulator n=1 Tax=Tateyamaria sp. syn59 TaxID=2576942 RepID=UPI0011BEF3EE|nr:TetR/AcrR family transcriptional regulator [Tateyamaria sp. syn59]
MNQLEKTQLDTRTRIIETATDMFLLRGFSGTSMSAIAQSCNMTKASLYHHFQGKEDLFIACVTYGYADALEALAAIAADGSLSAEQKLRAAVDALYTTMIISPVGRMSPLIAEVSRAFPSVARSFHTEYVEPQRATLWGIVEEGQHSGAFRNFDKNQFFHLAFGPMVTLSLSREMFATFDDLDDHFPVDDLRDGHAAVLLKILAPE